MPVEIDRTGCTYRGSCTIIHKSTGSIHNHNQEDGNQVNPVRKDVSHLKNFMGKCIEKPAGAPNKNEGKKIKIVYKIECKFSMFCKI
jgi:hypothetical protein